MTRMNRNQHDHVLGMIERMQRDGTPEGAIHEAVRRAVKQDRPERRQRRRPGVLSLIRRRPSQA
jgi:hypothetical protein